MKKRSMVFMLLFLGALSQLTACAPVSMIANIAAAGMISKSSAERKADKCYEIDTQATKEKVSRPERNRRLSKVGCPI